ncbi:hypothetical protein Cantr_04786 [Candida viswanathii]|uniref:Secreted protein CSS2 C-terminal domain-containing protein n=1 Tax=Candida viswanathii TaxID=5486 RepID=A0A367XM46_9ASCO|nr:hypothetical protein Cantr_04786 [Candida viswanathii]
MQTIQNAYTFSVSFVGLASDGASFGNTVAGWIKGASQKKQCVGQQHWIDLDFHGQRRTFLVAIAPYTTGKNCDTTASQSAIAYLLQQRIGTIEQGNWSEWCHALNNGGTWHADVRITLWEDATNCGVNVWDIPCSV